MWNLCILQQRIENLLFAMTIYIWGFCYLSTLNVYKRITLFCMKIILKESKILSFGFSSGDPFSSLTSAFYFCCRIWFVQLLTLKVIDSPLLPGMTKKLSPPLQGSCNFYQKLLTGWLGTKNMHWFHFKHITLILSSNVVYLLFVILLHWSWKCNLLAVIWATGHMQCKGIQIFCSSLL